jgi:ubiquinone/menaquinone biosynthesis C-methylase UbiE
MNTSLIQYYHERAKEYEKVYSIPEEQSDLLTSITLFQELFATKTVLEVACGTGYWTNHISKTATAIFATDINERMVNIAKERVRNPNAIFAVADMFSLKPNGAFDAFFGGFIWSHIVLQDIDQFLRQVSKLLKPHSIIVFIDSKPVANSCHDIRSISKKDAYGNTYQTRQLEDGSKHIVLKNFPTEEFHLEKQGSIAAKFQYIALDHYWITIANLK